MYKLRIVTIFLLIFSSTLITGQTNRFDIGFEIGPSLRSLRVNNNNSNNDLSFGFSSGFTFQYNFPKLISIRTNVSFESKGFTNRDHIGETNLYGNFNYITIPLLIRLFIDKKNIFFLNAGPYFGYLTYQNYTNEAFRIFSGTDESYHYKKTDFGITTGLGTRFPIKSKLFLSFEIRNNYGVYDISFVPYMDNRSVKTTSTSLLIGIEYRFSSRESN